MGSCHGTYYKCMIPKGQLLPRRPCKVFRNRNPDCYRVPCTMQGRFQNLFFQKLFFCLCCALLRTIAVPLSPFTCVYSQAPEINLICSTLTLCQTHRATGHTQTPWSLPQQSNRSMLLSMQRHSYGLKMSKRQLILESNMSYCGTGIQNRFRVP